MSAETHPWTYIHPACGNAAHHRVAVPLPTDAPLGRDFEHLDGSPVANSEEYLCDSCGKLIVENPFNSDFWKPVTDPKNWRPRAEVEKNG